MNGQYHAAFAAGEHNLNGLGIGVAMNIRERLLENPEQRQLHVFGQAARDRSELQTYSQAATLGETVGVPTCGGFETYLLEKRWMQQV